MAEGDRPKLRPVVIAFAVATALIMSVEAQVGATQSPPLVQVSHDRFAVPRAAHRTEVEPATLAVGHTIVAAFQVGRDPEGAAFDIGVASSANDGVTWSSGLLRGATANVGGFYGRASDPSVAYDAVSAAWMVGYLAITFTGRFHVPTRSAIQIARSVDGGVSFEAPITIAKAPRGVVYDKPWIACDGGGASPHVGRCYAVWDALGLRAGPFAVILLSTSVDGGLHWGAPVRTLDRAHGVAGIPVVRPDGTVVVPYINTERLPQRIEAFSSADGGSSWSGSVTIAIERRAEVRNIRDSGFPSVAIDEAGSIFVAWSDCRFEPRCAADDIVLSTSADGSSWTRPSRVPIPRPRRYTSLLTPGLAASGRGHRIKLGLLYYAVSRMGVIRVASVTSRDGGATWGPATGIGWSSRARWYAESRAGFFWGDYVTSSFLRDGRFTAVLPFAQRPAGLLDVAMYAPAGGLRG